MKSNKNSDYLPWIYHDEKDDENAILIAKDILKLTNYINEISCITSIGEIDVKVKNIVDLLEFGVVESCGNGMLKWRSGDFVATT
jgi:hypothetical protein